MLESIPAIEGLETIAFTQDGKKLLLARQDGLISVQSLLALGQSQASSAAIVSASFHGGGKYLLCGSVNGGMTLWNRAAFKTPQAVFQGIDAPINQSKVSSDGRYVFSVYEDADNSTYVWDLDASNSSTSKIEPRLIIKSEVASSSAAFTSDSKFLLVGGSDGVIRAWSLADNREIARFEGHQGPVMDISPVADAGHFVSGGIDHSIRSWRFPSSLPPPGADIPQGALADATKVTDLEPPKSLEEIQDEDPNDAARQALIAGAGTADILDLMEGDEHAKAEAKQSLARVVAVEKGSSVSGEELSRQRRRLAAAQRRLAPSENALSLSSFAEGFSNLSFMADSNFKFGLDRTYRPVRLLFADRFLYAARTSATRKQARRNDDGELEEIDEGDNGALLSWDYRYSRLQAHAWSIENLAVSELYPLPNSAGVFTVPQVILFSQDGSSRELSDIASWAASNQPMPQRQFLAVGTAGAQREENDILKVFDVADLSRNNVAPTSQYRSFEGVVTAMAFANTSPHIAFSVRERAVHRLFIADAETLQLTKLEEYNHDEPWIESDDPGGQARVGTRRGRSNVGSSGAAPGITSLAFSPQDSILVAQGEYNKSLHKFSRWKLSWNKNGELESFRKSSKELENEGEPFFLNSGSKSIWFITKGPRRQPTPSADASPKSPDAGVLKVLVRVGDGFSVVNLNSQREEHKIKFLKTHHGIPEYTISNDGRWLMMGDDNGLAYIWDTYEGTRFCITIDAATEQRIQQANGRRLEDVPERPAHTGPIVGVALSEPDPGRDYPAFAATIGEENKLKVWELYPLLDPDTGLRSTNVARSVTRTINTTSLRKRDR
jgi:WD40 repeat protein